MILLALLMAARRAPGHSRRMLIWAADKLVSLANANRGPDNISVIIARRFNPNRTPIAVNMEETNPGE